MGSINIRPHFQNRALLKHTHTQSLYAMNAGDGPLSYVQNSSYQRGIIDVAKPIIEQEIATKLDIKQIYSNNPNGFCTIADFGCSTGHNSFPVMQLITQAINRKLEYSSHKIPEFHVYFNDVVTNDFNTLFSSLPRDRLYSAAAVPGDFHGRLLPEHSLHFGYSAWSLQWLTEIPKVVADRDSPAWNKGEILYRGDIKEVCEAYLEQYSRDIESFLKSRAVEMVGGGLIAFLVPGVPEFWNPEIEYSFPSGLNLLGSCLIDMAKQGRLSKPKVDSFNLPFYFTTQQQLKAILERSHSFSIERMEILDNPGKYTLASANARAAFFRAGLERMLTNHFGSEIIDELFDLYTKKLIASPVFVNPDNDKSIVILVVLKRKID
ncbi:hypothetical protein DH2020_032120 [Rehmannia glutinosa]|uniref:S-adenosylmethionine-dependent methyltransferase n=1 Tax=Rehmannia glutinosa TaxID=99300 RepID=A0ABR0VK58_REHGL